jgi:hypothetical protein
MKLAGTLKSSAILEIQYFQILKVTIYYRVVYYVSVKDGKGTRKIRYEEVILTPEEVEVLEKKKESIKRRRAKNLGLPNETTKVEVKKIPVLSCSFS